MKTRKIYTREMYRQFRYLATWAPGTPMKLGDIGILKGKEFIRIGNISDFGISFETVPDDTPLDLEFASEGSVSITTKLSGRPTIAKSNLITADVGATVIFSKKNAIYFKADKTTTPSIKNQIALGQEILSLWKEGKWDKHWAVITELVTAKSASIIISSSKEAQVDIRATSEIGNKPLNIADPEFGWELSFEKDVTTKIIAEEGITPLFKISKIKRRVFASPTFRTKGIDGMDIATPNMMAENATEFDFDITEPEEDFELLDEI